MTHRPAPDPTAENGMILFNVLTIVAVSSAVVMLMLSSQDVEVQRSLRLREAAQAAAYARAGELSAVTALRRDAVEAPNTDNLREPWASVAQTDIGIAGGRFSLAIADAQARFNVNAVATGGLIAETLLRKIGAAVGVQPVIASRIIAYERTVGPVGDMSDLSAAGVDEEAIKALSTFVTVLPGDPGVNINTADVRLIAMMINNPVAAQILAAQRDRAGLLTPQDVVEARAQLPRGLGFTSDHYLVQTWASVGDTQQTLTSLLERQHHGRFVEVVAIARKRGTAAPEMAPPS